MTDLYMVEVQRTRTGQTRHYRIFGIYKDAVEDVTAMVCKRAGIKWNNVLGTYDSKAAYRAQDVDELRDNLHCVVEIL